MKGSFRIGGPQDLSCDVLIVGSGAGGASVAETLTEAGLDVLMLEEGPYVPNSAAPSRASDAFLQSWRCGGLTAALGKPPVAYAEGRVVGGGTEINSAIIQFPSEDLLADWAKTYHIAGFGSAALEEPFAWVRKVLNSSLTPGPLGRPSDILVQGAKKLRWQVSALERAQRACVGTNFCSFVCPTGGKQSMSVTLLPSSLGRGLRLISECRVHRLLIHAKRVRGAVALAKDSQGCVHRLRVRAGAVFLCAGAIHTPALLQRSGIRGPFGATLRMHPTVKALSIFDSPVDAHECRLPLHAITEFMPSQRIGGSVFSPSIYAMSLAEDWKNRAPLLPDWRCAAIYYAMIRPTGFGRVRSVPFGVEPIVTYQHSEDDWNNLVQVTRRLVQLLFAAGARRVVPSIAGHPGWVEHKRAADELEAGLPRSRVNLTTVHLFSTCPPGENPDRSVTDSFGCVRGFANLFIADASQIPEATGCNPQAMVMALARRNSLAYLAGSYRHHRAAVTLGA